MCSDFCVSPSQHVCEADDRDEVVVCELCEVNVANFNQHMKKSHPGCGRSANRQGYRSNGSYVDGWFGGECGSGNPYYLLCGGCRDKYLAIKSKAKVPAAERSASCGRGLSLPVLICPCLCLLSVFPSVSWSLFCLVLYLFLRALSRFSLSFFSIFSFLVFLFCSFPPEDFLSYDVTSRVLSSSFPQF